MFRTLMSGGIAALMLTTAAFAESRPQSVRSIEVEADLTAVENPTAATYWATLADDLKSAIATRVADRTAEDGVAITVDVEEVELSSGFQETLGLADTRLTGKVRVRSEEDPSRDQTYDLTVDVNQATPLLPAGTDLATLPAGSRVYYDAMVGAFADAVVRSIS